MLIVSLIAVYLIVLPGEVCVECFLKFVPVAVQLLCLAYKIQSILSLLSVFIISCMQQPCLVKFPDLGEIGLPCSPSGKTTGKHVCII